MKKTYQIPTLDSAEMRFCTALLEGSVLDNSKPGQPGATPDEAPKRVVF